MAGVVWAASQFLGAQPFSLAVFIDVGQVFFPLTGTIPVRPGDLLRLVVSVGLLGGCPFFSACVTALVVGGRRFLLCFLLLGFLLGRVALTESRGGVAVRVIVDFCLLGGNLSAGTLATSLSGRSFVVAHAHELGE